MMDDRLSGKLPVKIVTATLTKLARHVVAPLSAPALDNDNDCFFTAVDKTSQHTASSVLSAAVENRIKWKVRAQDTVWLFSASLDTLEIG